MSEPWFGRKRIGYGYRPATPMGWLVVLVFIAVIVAAAAVFFSGPSPEPAAFGGVAVVAVLALLAVIYVKRDKQS